MEPEPTAEEQAAALEELARVRVRDVLLQAAFNLSTVASARLGIAPGTESMRDTGEARRAIDALTGLVPLLAPELEPAEMGELRQMVAGLQMAYAQVAGQAGPPAGPGPTGGAERDPGAGPPPPPPRGPEPDRPRIWTPRGDV